MAYRDIAISELPIQYQAKAYEIDLKTEADGRDFANSGYRNDKRIRGDFEWNLFEQYILQYHKDNDAITIGLNAENAAHDELTELQGGTWECAKGAWNSSWFGKNLFKL